MLTVTRKVQLLIAASVLSVFLGGGFFFAAAFRWVSGAYPLAMLLDGVGVLLLVLAFVFFSAASGVLKRAEDDAWKAVRR